ncbi:MAG: acyl-CoA dehydrogenase family protein [Thaumarchaeota archaeon]|nr:acyl-CoA dehydrogenase family protein [Nitrososphaerota archaeon]
MKPPTEPLFSKSIEDLKHYAEFPDSSITLLEKVDAACEELYLPEVEHYLARKYNEQIPLILKKHNLLGIPIKEEYGGLGTDAVTYTLALERMGQVGMGLVTFVDVHISLAGLTLQQWGNQSQKDTYLKPAVKGEKILAYALTEPEAGSDPASLKTTFREENGQYVLNGSKYMISNGSIADALIVFANPKDLSGGMSAFIVDSKTEGFEVAMKLDEKAGLFTSDTALLAFNDCRVPKENLLGEKGKGIRVAYSALVNGRIGVASGCIGVLENCLNECIERAKHRTQHGKEIARHQLVQRHIAAIALNLEMARWPTYYAAIKKAEHDADPGNTTLRNDLDQQSALAKRIASKLAFEGADHAMQVFGGYGYSILAAAARHFIDTRVTRIYEGTDEIMDLKIASGVLGKEYEAYK